jgi:hypothetical protein
MKRANDLVGGVSGLLLWCLPIAAIVAGGSWQAARFWLWIPAFFVMGAACAVNAMQCRRTHCYITAPLYLLAAAYLVLVALKLAPINYNIFMAAVVAVTVMAFLAEVPLGKYGGSKNT